MALTPSIKGTISSPKQVPPTHPAVLIVGDSGFVGINGVLSGSGTVSDPYVIGNWQINSQGSGISVYNTTRAFVIQNVQILSILTGNHGILLHNVTNGAVRSSTITNSTIGISVDHSTGITIADNTISDQTGTGITSAKGIVVNYCTKLSITGNKISSLLTHQKPGIFINASPNPTISRNTLWYSAFAITLNNTARAIVIANNASYNQATGLFLIASPYASVTGNYITNNAEGIRVATYDGLSKLQSQNCTFTGNVVSYNTEQAIVISSDNSTISQNEISYNQFMGIEPSGGNNTILEGNTFGYNGIGGISCCTFLNSCYYCPSLTHRIAIIDNTFTYDGILLNSIRGTGLNLTVGNNLVNGKPLLFYQNCKNLDINGVQAGQIILSNCTGVRMSNLRITNTLEGIELLDVNSASVMASDVNSNNMVGIYLWNSFDITISGDNLSNNGGLLFRNSIYTKPAYTSPSGIVRDPSGYVSYGLTAYSNNFVEDVAFGVSGDQWNSSYPNGGNYWSTYRGVDSCSGVRQDICPKPDGIGDTPFQVSFTDPNGYPVWIATDYYPLVSPRLSSPDTEPPTWIPNSNLTAMNTGSGSVTLYWPKATDDVGVLLYDVYEGNTLLGAVYANSTERLFPAIPIGGYNYTLNGLTPGTTYTFKIVAIDQAGNKSVNGISASVTMPGTVPPWIQYWYLIVVAGAVIAAIVAILKRRKRNLPTSTQVSQTVPNDTQRPPV